MEIIWFGHACCALMDEVKTVVTDPYNESLGMKLPELTADIVTVSHDNPHHNATHLVTGSFKIIDRPGEYEIGGVFIHANAFYPAKAKGEQVARKRNISFVYEMADIRIGHLGDIAHIPSQSQIESLDNVDVLLVPVGGGSSLNAAKASEVIGLIEPSIVIPIHYALPDITISLEALDKFLQEMGQSHVVAQDKLKISFSTLPTETQLVVLTPYTGD